MKKTLAIVLSVAMVLAMMAGMFTFNTFAEEKPYAEQQAEALWAEATKATELNFGGIVVQNNTTDMDLATAKADLFATGTLTFKDGVLTLKNVTLVEGKTYAVCEANGGMKVDFTGADINVAFKATAATVPAKSHVIVTSSDGHDLKLPAGNAIRSNNGAVVTYGPMGLEVDAGSGGYDCVMVGNTGKTVAYPLILGNTGGTVLTAGGTGPAIESRAGDIVICGNGDFTFKNTNAAYTGSAVAFRWPEQVKNSALRITEAANVSFETVGGEAIRHEGPVEAGKDAIVIDTTGTVKFTTTALNVNTWEQGNVVTVRQGAVKIASKVLVKMNVNAYTGGCGCAFYLNNSGKDTAAGLYLSDNAELAISLVSNAANVRTTGVWVNTGVVDVSDNAKFTVRYEHKNTFNINFSAVVLKVGRFNISDNARVYLHGINSGTKDSSGQKAIDIQAGGDGEAAARAFFGDNGGLHVTGGQLEVNTPSDFINYPNNKEARGATHFSGGVVSVQDVGGKGQYLFPQNLDQVTETRFNEVKNAAYCGPVTLDDGTKVVEGHADYNLMNRRSGNVAEYLYAATGATYVPYDGIAANADFFGNLTTAHNDLSYFKAEEGTITSATVVKADGTSVELNATNTTVAGTTGTVTLDAAAGTLYVDGVSGIAKILPGEGKAVINLLGTNEVKCTAVEGNTTLNGKNLIWSSGDLVFIGNGTLDVYGDAYALGSAGGTLTFNGPTVNVTTTGGTAIHTTKDGKNGNMTVKGASVLNVAATGGNGIDLQGINPFLTVTDNAKVTINASGDAIKLSANAGTAGGNTTSTLTVSGKAVLDIKDGNVGARVEGMALTKHVSTVIITDEATVTSVSRGQGLLANGAYAGGSSKFEISGKANVDVTVNQTGDGGYGQGLDIRGTKAIDVDITTTGTVNVTAGASKDWNGAAMRLVPADANTALDMYVKDTTLNLTNNGYADGKTTLGLYFDAKRMDAEEADYGKLVIDGDAKVTVKVTDEKATENRNAGIFLSAASMEVKGNAKVTVDAKGAKKANTGAAIGTKKANVIVSEKGQIVATANGTNSAVLLMENVDKLIAKDDGTITLTGDGVPAIGHRTANCITTISAEGAGKITATGKNATNFSGNVTVKAKQTGANDAATVVYEGENSKTSDNVISVAAIVLSISAVAVAAAVVLRKRSYNA